MTRGLQAAIQNLFILAEAMAWFIVIRVLVTTVEHGVLSSLLGQVERGMGGPVGDQNVQDAMVALRDALDGIAAGPSLPLVLFAAFAAFLLAQVLSAFRLSPAMAAVIGLLASVVLLNVVLHVTLAGDFRVWDNSGVAAFMDGNDSPFTASADVKAFVADPEVKRITGGAATLTVTLLLVMWARFAMLGRATIDFDRALRSFSIGFPVVVVAVVLSRIAGGSAAIFALPYFVLSMLTLAVANAARSSEEEMDLSDSAPWAVSALASLGVLAVVAAIFGTLAALEVERVLAPATGLVLDAVSWVLVIVLGPVFWALERVIDWAMGDVDLSILLEAEEAAVPIFEDAAEQQEPYAWPGWVEDGIRLAGFAALAGGLYFLARLLFFRKPRADRERGYAEERASTTRRTGLGDLLRNLVPRRSARERGDPWLDRHAVYRLFARTVTDSEQRGFPRRPGETPMEFGAAAGRTLESAAIPAVAVAFDRARYGRRYPAEEELGPLTVALEEWEQAHPVSESAEPRDERQDQPPAGEPPVPPMWPDPPPPDPR